MIWHAVLPRSPEWIVLRLGIPCSSEFHRIMTPKTGKLSSQAPALMHRLLAEWITGEQVENASETTEWMQRGVELEDKAIAAYETITDAETTVGGFFTTDDGMIGCSPDRLVGDKGDLEIKVPLLQTQVGYALGGLGADYMLQLQGRMMIHDREFCDIFSYHDRLTIPPLRVYRDEKMIAGLREALTAFVETMLKCRETLEQKYGPFTRMRQAVPDDHSEDFLTEQDAEDVVAMIIKENNGKEK